MLDDVKEQLNWTHFRLWRNLFKVLYFHISEFINSICLNEDYFMFSFFYSLFNLRKVQDGTWVILKTKKGFKEMFLNTCKKILKIELFYLIIGLDTRKQTKWNTIIIKNYWIFNEASLQISKEIIKMLFYFLITCSIRSLLHQHLK